MIKSSLDDHEELDFDEIFDDDEGNDNFGGLAEEYDGEKHPSV
jgi:hypothetical protein